jgi:hypothetical protein
LLLVKTILHQMGILVQMAANHCCLALATPTMKCVCVTISVINTWPAMASATQIIGHLTCIFMILFPKIQFDTTSVSMSCSQGQESAVGTATHYGVDGPGIESWWGARFSTPVHTTPGPHLASYTTGTGSFPGVKRPWHGVDHPSPSSTEVEGRVELHICSPSGSSWPVLGWTLLYFYVLLSQMFSLFLVL